MFDIVILATAAAAAAPKDLKTYADWIVGCDNGRACQAVALMPQDDIEGTTMVIERGAGARAVPKLSINIVSGAVSQAVAVDGKRLRARIDNVTGPSVIAGADALTAIETMRRGKAMTVLDASGKVIGRPSLAGMSAALLYMDEQQRRLDTVTALARKGMKPASTVPPPPALPVIVSPKAPKLLPRKLAAADIERTLKPLECEASETSMETSYARLDAKTSLALLPAPCGNGAYNYYSYALLIDNAGKVRPATFEISGGMGEGSDNSLVNADWDEKSREITTYAKGRGLGDCGSIQAYAWDGRSFRLKRMGVMGECRGSMDYIPVWRTVVR